MISNAISIFLFWNLTLSSCVFYVWGTPNTSASTSPARITEPRPLIQTAPEMLGFDSELEHEQLGLTDAILTAWAKHTQGKRKEEADFRILQAHIRSIIEEQEEAERNKKAKNTFKRAKL